MADTEVIAARPDVDIEEDVYRLIAHYPPLAHDRHRIKVSAKAGVVTVEGYVKARTTRRYLLDKLPSIQGVKSVNADGFYDDELIRLEVGRVVPTGVQVIVEYGAVILAGERPEGVNAEQIAAGAKKVPGVHKVVSAFEQG